DLVEVERLLAGERAQSKIVDRENVDLGDARQATLVGSVSATRTQLAEELLSEDVLRGVAAPAGPQREGLGEMALAQAGSADAQDVLCARHELAGCDEIGRASCRERVAISVVAGVVTRVL